jgi:hypothetical protein
MQGSLTMSGSSSAKRGRDWHMTDDEKRLLERVRGMYGSTGKSPRGELLFRTCKDHGQPMPSANPTIHWHQHNRTPIAVQIFLMCRGQSIPQGSYIVVCNFVVTMLPQNCRMSVLGCDVSLSWPTLPLLLEYGYPPPSPPPKRYPGLLAV